MPLNEDKFALIQFIKKRYTEIPISHLFRWNSHGMQHHGFESNCDDQHELVLSYKQQSWYGLQNASLGSYNFPVEKQPCHYHSLLHFFSTPPWIVLSTVVSPQETMYHEIWSTLKVNYKKIDGLTSLDNWDWLEKLKLYSLQHFSEYYITNMENVSLTLPKWCWHHL